jgi:uncharacterized protein YggT (Ycf19 family)
MIQSIFVRLINVIIGVVEAILGIHILLKLFSANPDAPFVRWMYSISDPFLRPFRGIFEDFVFRGEYVLDLSAVFAIIIYGIAGNLVMMFFRRVDRG